MLQLAELEAKYAYVQAKLSDQKEQVSTTETLINKVEKRINMLTAKIAKAEFKGNSDKAEMLTEKLVKAEKRLEKLDERLDRQTAQDDEDAVISGYTIEEIAHAFEYVDPYVTISEGYMVINSEDAVKDPNVTTRDIQIMEDFAEVNNKMREAFVGQTDQSVIDDAIEYLEAGKFHALFDPVNTPNKNSVSATVESQAPIVLVAYDYFSAPVMSAFGVDEAKITKVGLTDLTSIACDGGFSDPHDDLNFVQVPKRGTSYPNAAYAIDIIEGHSPKYHKVWWPMTGHDNDYSRTDTSAPGNCNSGPFREQALVWPTGNGDTVVIRYETDEPNPVLYSYIWPAGWWGSYTWWWHEHYT